MINVTFIFETSPSTKPIEKYRGNDMLFPHSKYLALSNSINCRFYKLSFDNSQRNAGSELCRLLMNKLQHL